MNPARITSTRSRRRLRRWAIAGLVLFPLSLWLPAVAQAFDETAALREGYGHLNGQRWAKAEAPFKQVVARKPAHREALLALTLVWRQLGKLDEALAAVDKVLKNDATNALGLYRRGQVLFTMKDYGRAELEFRRVLRLAPKLEPAWTRFYLGLSLSGLSRSESAIFWLNSAYKRDPKTISANLYYYRNLAILLMNEGRLVRARKIFGAGLKRFPKDLILLHNAGRAQDALGNRDALRGYFDRAATEAYARLTLTPRPLFDLPFRGRWVLALGHDSLPTHVGLQTYALDFVRVNSAGQAYRGSGSKNIDYWGFGADILAPGLGTIISVHDGAPDHRPKANHDGDIGPGNYVVIQHAGGIRSDLLHLKKGSIAVRPGQTVQRGDKIGEAGNSGYSKGPHLHFSFSRQLDDAWVSVPVEFRNFTLRRDGSADSLVKGAPARGDSVEPAS